MNSETKAVTYLKFLKVCPTKLPDGVINDYVYKCADGMEHVAVRTIERANDHGILEGIIIVENHKVTEKLEILTEDRPYSLKKIFKASHLVAMSKAADFYHNLCKRFGF